MCEVVNLRNEKYDIYIGRGSKWGNPYSHKEGTKALYVVSSREEAIEKFEEYLFDSGLIKSINELKYKKLGCFCKPEKCHGDILKKYVNRLENEEKFNESLNYDW